MRRILLIDDEPDIRAVARVAIELVAGWEMVEADSGERGLEIAREAQPDAALIDYMMPQMDGPATVKALRADPECSTIPLIFLTAKDLGDSHDWLIDGVIAKPFDPLTLGHDIAQRLGWE